MRKRMLKSNRATARYGLTAAGRLVQEAMSSRLFMGGFASLLDAMNVDDVLDRLAEGDYSALIDMIDWFEWEQAMTDQVAPQVKRHIEIEGRRSFREIQRGGQRFASDLTRQGVDYVTGTSPAPLDFDIPAAPSRGGGFHATARFDMTNPYAIREAEQFAAQLVREVSASTRRAIQDAVTDSFRSGVTAQELARRLRNTIGLTTRQAHAVENYRARLFNNEYLDEDRIEALTRRYYRKTLKRRAETIARTEIMRASNFGRMQGWLAAADAGMLDPSNSVKEWITAPESTMTGKIAEPCPSCAPMDGVKVTGLDADFVMPGGRTLAMPPAHPNCRCTAVVWPPEPPEDFDPSLGADMVGVTE